MKKITVAIHTLQYALNLKKMLEAEGIAVSLENINPDETGISPGVRVRINDTDLPLALRVIENTDIFVPKGAAIPLHPILVPVDCSDLSLQAVAVAADLARKHQRELVLLYAYLDPSLDSNLQLGEVIALDLSIDAEARMQMEQTAHTVMHRFVSRVTDAMKDGKIENVKFNTSVVEGVPEDVIREYARNNAPYLVVMGTRSARRKADEMIGSVTAEVIDKNRCTVLTVPETLNRPENVASPKSILFLGNLEQEDILAFDTMHRLFPEAGISVTISHYPGRRKPSDAMVNESLEKLCEYCSRNFPAYSVATMKLSGDDTFNSLLQYIQNFKVDLVVIANKRKNALARLISAGIANRLLSSADIPMLVIRV